MEETHHKLVLNSIHFLPWLLASFFLSIAQWTEMFLGYYSPWSLVYRLPDILTLCWIKTFVGLILVLLCGIEEAAPIVSSENKFFHIGLNPWTPLTEYSKKW